MSVYLNLQSVRDQLSIEKMHAIAPDSLAYLKQVQFPKISATSIAVFKEFSDKDFSFPQFAGRLHAAKRECKQNLQLHERRLVEHAKSTAAVAALVAYVDLVVVEFFGVLSWPSAIFWSVPATVWGVKKLEELHKPKDPIKHKTFDAALEALDAYKAYFTGDNFKTLETRITTKLHSRDGVEKRIYERALDELHEASSFSK